MFKTLFTSVLLTLAPMVSLASTPVEFEISGVEGNQGNVVIAIFDNEEDWLDRSQALLLIERPASEAKNGKLVYKAEINVPSTVSITAYHDIDGDKELKKGFFGKPLEPYGFANNIRHSTRAASFEEARTIISKDTKVKIEVKQ
jgi:uncharacterized protein (DUF2141 family)